MNCTERTVLVLLGTLTVACSADVTDHASRDSVAIALAADDADAGTAAEPSLPFSIEVAGASGAIPAHVTLGPLGHVTVDGYPTAAELQPTHGPLPVGFAGAFSADFCDDIRTLAGKSLGTSVLASWNLRQLRRSGGVALEFPVTPLVGPAFDAAVRASANEAGAPGTAFVVDNPLQIGSVRMQIDFDAGAISRIVGGLDAVVAEQRAYLAQQHGAIARHGSFSTAMSAKDVLCDLAAGDAQVSFTIEGRAGDTDYRGRTTLAALRAD